MIANCELSTGIVHNVKYIKATSKINGNSIYFPTSDIGYQNFYWCSDIHPTYTSNAQVVCFQYDKCTIVRLTDGYDRYQKLHIRPIRDRLYSPNTTQKTIALGRIKKLGIFTGKWLVHSDPYRAERDC